LGCFKNQLFIFYRSIIISTPTSTTPILLKPSRPVPPMATSSPQLPSRIGTPQRPYFSTVRAHLRNNARNNINISTSSLSTLSTPSSPVDGDALSARLDRIGVSAHEGEKTYQSSPGGCFSLLFLSLFFISHLLNY